MSVLCRTDGRRLVVNLATLRTTNRLPSNVVFMGDGTDWIMAHEVYMEIEKKTQAACRSDFIMLSKEVFRKHQPDTRAIDMHE
jgi:hypothetical protein